MNRSVELRSGYRTRLVAAGAEFHISYTDARAGAFLAKPEPSAARGAGTSAPRPDSGPDDCANAESQGEADKRAVKD
jgi:hypothetical protein